MKQHRTHSLGVPHEHGTRPIEADEAAARSTPPKVTALDRWLGARLARAVGHPPVAFALWDDVDVYTPKGESEGRVIFGDRGALFSSIVTPELGFGDCYSAGRIEISGDLVDVLHRIYRSMSDAGSNAGKRSILGRLPKARVNTRARSKKNIHYHYDLGNDFYQLWLDERMVYTCAYYSHPGASLEEAQVAKMDHVCRKAQLQPGQQVVEAGCGWGSLALHMARHYGVHVKAYNISHQQIVYARERAKAEGLEDCVEFIEDDYRNIEGQYDAFVSVGMLEHVGHDNYRTLGDVIHGALKKGGRGLIHSVGRSRPMAPNGWLEKRIFPGSYPPSLREMMDIFEEHDFSILDIENLRLHYAKTLMEWLERFDAHVQKISQSYDEAFVRAWRLYLGGCAAAFKASSIQLYQVLFAHPDDNRIPMTRQHLYGANDSIDWNLG